MKLGLCAGVDSCIRLRVSELPVRMIERLRAAVSFPNPVYRSRLRLGLHAGPPLETLCLMEESGGEIRLPRGAIHLLRRIATEEGLALNWKDNRTLPNRRLQPARELCLRDYQAAAVDRLGRVTQGMVLVCCGGGKTVTALGAIVRLGTPTVVLVHTLDLAEQWRSEIRDKLGIEAGLVGGGEKRSGAVTVALVQTLARWKPEKRAEFLSRFGLLVMDEAHHCPASSFRQVIDLCPARYRLGLTATPEREDGLSPMLELYFGPALLVVTQQQLIAAGVLTLPEVRVVETEFTHAYRGMEDYVELMNALAADPARNQLIVDAVVDEARAGQTCLVLSGRVDHCEVLASRIAAAGVSVAVLTGAVKRGRRKQLLAQARRGELSVLIATSLADEGLDLPRLSRVFLAFPSRARGRTEQRLGRLMRPHETKRDAVLYDFVDRRVPLLRQHHLERRKLYADVLGLPASKLDSGRGARGATV